MQSLVQVQNEFLKFLVSQGLLSNESAREVEQHASAEGVAADQLLVREKIISEEELTKRKAVFFGIPYADLTGQRVDPRVLKIIPKHVAENYHVVAFGRDAGELKVAIADPRNFQAMAALDVLASKVNLRLRYYAASPSSFDSAFKGYAELKGEVEEAAEVARKELEPTGKKDAAPVAEVIKGAPVSRIVSVIMRHAYEGHASDIHIELHQGTSRVRYRIDGVLRTTLTLPEALHSSIIARVKVLANLKLDETRVPQDGRITETIGDRPIDFRVSTLPLQEGVEKVVLRILSTESAPTLADLGFNAEHIKIIESNIKKPHGLILISGPTGAGKSTTLYAILTLLNREGINIVTLEDPIEYFIEGINQSQIRPEVGYTFATGLRSILRQDPNVIMVGEIRDGETAELGVHAGLTGHLLLTTIHTNDVLGVIPRLIDLKVEPFLLAATFMLGIAQRLARKICPDCKETAKIPDSLAAAMRDELKKIPKRYLTDNINSGAPLTFYRGRGCPKCGTMGYRGRVAVSEVLQVTPALSQLIADGFKMGDEVTRELSAQEMISMKQDALLKALQGLTTIEEVLRVSKE
ncbi:type II/IV secretion system protein [Candidatus Uhrbacteria bacterium]|nr:type II/IV secretion system protein [Candidatus Uhrbacteria bacterium]